VQERKKGREEKRKRGDFHIFLMSREKKKAASAFSPKSAKGDKVSQHIVAKAERTEKVREGKGLVRDCRQKNG